MRFIWPRLDKTRPVLILTRESVRNRLTRVTIAPITSRIRSLASEVPDGIENGLDQESVINLDNITTIPVADLGRRVGWYRDEATLAEALLYTFDLSG